MSQKRTSIIPHLHEIVQNVVWDTLKSRITINSKHQKAFEEAVVARAFDAEAQQVYKAKPSLAACMNMRDWKIYYDSRPMTKGQRQHLQEICKQASAMNTQMLGFFGLRTLKKAGMAHPSGGFVGNTPQHFSSSNADRELAGVTAISVGHRASYVRVGPNHKSTLHMTAHESYKDPDFIKTTEQELINALTIYIDSAQIYADARVLTRDLLVAFKQRKTVEGFKDDFPEWEKHVPYIETPVQALVIPSAEVVKKVIKASK